MAERIGIDELGRTAEKVRKRVEGYADGYISFPNCLRALERLDDVTTKATAELRSHRERELSGGWVACSDRMPEVLHTEEKPGCSEWVTVYAPARGRDMAFWDGERWYWRESGYAIPSEITHWQELPPAPEVSTHETAATLTDLQGMEPGT